MYVCRYAFMRASMDAWMSVFAHVGIQLSLTSSDSGCHASHKVGSLGTVVQCQAAIVGSFCPRAF